MSSESVRQERLPKITVMLHWVLASSVLFLFASSWWMLSLPLPSAEFTYRVLPFQLHKNIGMTLLLITVTMAAIRIANGSNRHLDKPDRMQKLAALDHLIMYFLLAACCFSGYLSSSYSGWETSFWWILNLPAWAEENDDLNILFSGLHLWSCWALLAVMTLHIGAAIYHGIVDDGLINKMFRL
ncbi:MAG: cytochrome b/b6 domain-containing protein [Proteobacteria bacterium]|nr:cytochrome b/b6 domain-containing protein [Pseudomonadota bacterium]